MMSLVLAFESLVEDYGKSANQESDGDAISLTLENHESVSSDELKVRETLTSIPDLKSSSKLNCSSPSVKAGLSVLTRLHKASASQ